MIRKILVTIVLCFFSIICSAQISYVNSNAQGANNGSSWNDAFTSLDTAIESTSSGQIWIAEGIYYPETDLDGNIPSDTRLRTFRFKNNVSLFGGFVGNETQLEHRDWEINSTILSGDIGVVGNIEDNVRNVVSSEYVELNANSTLDGLIIRDGYAYYQYSGAGIFINGAANGNFSIRNCTIENNFSFRDGGGIYVRNGDPVIENNIFRNNKSFAGGAMYLYYSDAVVRNNFFYENTTDDYTTIGSTAAYGGALYVAAYSSPIIENNLFENNYARERGGAVDFQSNYHSTFQNNMVINNEAKEGGGLHIGNSIILFFNNVIVKNQATERGGGVYFDYVFEAEMINNTIAYNSATYSGGAIFSDAAGLNLVNTIINNNISSDNLQININYTYGNFTSYIRYCNIENGLSTIGSIGTQDLIYNNNIDDLPEFVSVGDNDFSLFETSSSIDAGTYSHDIVKTPWTGSNGQVVHFPEYDILGNIRIINSIDIGAHEYGVLGNETPNFSPKLDVNVYPNPNKNGILNYDTGDRLFEKVEVFDIIGRLLYAETILSHTGKINLPVSRLNLIIIKFSSDEYSISKKIIVN